MHRTGLVLIPLFSLIATEAVSATLTMDIARHPLASQGRVEGFLGTPVPGNTPFFVSPTLGFSGTAVVELELDAADSGTFRLASTHIGVEDVPTTTINVLTLGSLDIAFTGLIFDIETATVPVTNGAFSVTSSTPGALRLVGGHLTTSNHTGQLANLLNPVNRDFGIFQAEVPFSMVPFSIHGTVDDGPGLYLLRPELNIGDPFFIVDDITVSPVTIRFIPELHFSVVPEAGFLLWACALVTPIGCLLLRRRFPIHPMHVFHHFLAFNRFLFCVVTISWIATSACAADFFEEDFNSGVPNPLLQGYSNFTLADDVIRRNGSYQDVNDRRYISTVATDYNEVDFDFGLTFTTQPLPQTSIHFLGIGFGDRRPGGEFAHNEPWESLFLRIHAPNVNGGPVTISNHPATDLGGLGNLPTAGTHRALVRKRGDEIVFQIDADYDGTFQSDMSYTVPDYHVVAPFLNASKSRLFFGTVFPNDSFDDFQVAVPEPSSFALGVIGVLALGMLAMGRRFRAWRYAPVSSRRNVMVRSLGAAIAAACILVTPSSLFAEFIAGSAFNDATGLYSNPAPNSPFTFGALIDGGGAGEPGWARPWEATIPMATVQNSTLFEGDGALLLTPTTSVNRAWVDPQTGVFSVTQRVLFTEGARYVAYTQVEATGESISNHGAIWAAFPDRTILAVDGTEDGCFFCHTEPTGFTWEPGVWHTVQVRVDMANRTWDLFFDGQKYDAPDPLGFRGTPTYIDRVQFLSEGSGNVYMDDLRIVPEPSSVMLLGLSIAGVAATWRIRNAQRPR